MTTSTTNTNAAAGKLVRGHQRPALALRRDSPPDSPEVSRLRDALNSGERIFSTGTVLRELLQGIRGPNAVAQIARHFQAIPMITHVRGDHVGAADLRNECRRRGVQVGTVDALLAQICMSRELVMLSTDRDFNYIENWTLLQLWRPTIMD